MITAEQIRVVEIISEGIDTVNIDTNFNEYSCKRREKLVAGGGSGVQRIFVFKTSACLNVDEKVLIAIKILKIEENW